MGKCSFCRCDTNSSTCPNCGAPISNEIKVIKNNNKSIINSSSEYNDPRINYAMNSLDNLEGCLGKRLITFIACWIFMIILGIILTLLLRKNDIEFIKKYYNIFQIIRLFLLSFGWIPALIISRKKR